MVLIRFMFVFMLLLERNLDYLLCRFVVFFVLFICGCCDVETPVA